MHHCTSTVWCSLRYSGQRLHFKEGLTKMYEGGHGFFRFKATGQISLGTRKLVGRIAAAKVEALHMAWGNSTMLGCCCGNLEPSAPLWVYKYTKDILFSFFPRFGWFTWLGQTDDFPILSPWVREFLPTRTALKCCLITRGAINKGLTPPWTSRVSIRETRLASLSSSSLKICAKMWAFLTVNLLAMKYHRVRSEQHWVGNQTFQHTSPNLALSILYLFETV